VSKLSSVLFGLSEHISDNKILPLLKTWSRRAHAVLPWCHDLLREKCVQSLHLWAVRKGSYQSLQHSDQKAGSWPWRAARSPPICSLTTPA